MRSLRAPGLVSLSLACAACAFGGGERIPVATYVLELPADFEPGVVGPRPACGILEVQPPEAFPGFGSSRMIYLREPYRLQYFAYAEWADSPARMLEPLMVRALEETGLFSSVVSAPSPVKPDLRLESEGLRLQQAFESGGSRTELELRARLVDPKQRELLGTRNLAASVESGGDPAAGVAAANRALEGLLADLIGFVGEAVSGSCTVDDATRAARRERP